jgi:hypothetical protein
MVYTRNIPHLLSIAILLFIPTIITIMPTEINKAIPTRLSSAAALAKRTFEKERLEQKKKNAEERKAEESAKKAEDNRLLEEAIKSNDKWLAAQEAKKKKDSALTMTSTPNADTLMSEIDTPHVSINDHLSSHITPSKDHSPVKAKRKTTPSTLTTKQSAIRLSSKFSPETKIHTHGFSLVLAVVVTKGEDPVVQFVTCIKSLVKDIKTVGQSACLVNLHDRIKTISDPALVPINQTALGAYVKVSTYGDKNPFNKQKNKDNNNKNSNSKKKKMNGKIQQFTFRLHWLRTLTRMSSLKEFG